MPVSNTMPAENSTENTQATDCEGKSEETCKTESQVEGAEPVSPAEEMGELNTLSLCFEALKNEDYHVRSKALDNMKNYFIVEAQDYVKDLIVESLKDENETVLTSAVFLLGKIAIGLQNSITHYSEVLTLLASQEDVKTTAILEENRQQARDEIEIIVDKFTNLLREFEGDKDERYKEVRKAAAMCLGDLGKDAVSALWALNNSYYDEHEYQSVCDEAEKATKKINDSIEKK